MLIRIEEEAESAAARINSDPPSIPEAAPGNLNQAHFPANTLKSAPVRPSVNYDDFITARAKAVNAAFELGCIFRALLDFVWVRQSPA